MQPEKVKSSAGRKSRTHFRAVRCVMSFSFGRKRLGAIAFNFAARCTIAIRYGARPFLMDGALAAFISE
jgi:hypothetical protein